MIIEIVIEGYLYRIDDDDEVCVRIMNDPEFARMYVGQCNQPPPAETDNSAETDVEQHPELLEQEDNVAERNSWDHKSILLFLEECIARKADLRNPKIRRKTVFEAISKVLEVKGVFFDANLLDTKLKNMKIRYNIIVDNNKKTSTGRGRMSWPYFEKMQDLYSDEVQVKDTETISSLKPSTPSTSSAASDQTRKNKKSLKRPDFKDKIIEIEEKKLKVAQELLHEIRELRKLKTLKQKNPEE